MKHQLNLDFDRPLSGVCDGKKTERMTFTASSDLKEFLAILATKMDTSISELCQKYIIAGLQKAAYEEKLAALTGHSFAPVRVAATDED